MAPVRRIVLDVLKPHEPRILDFTTAVGSRDDVNGVTATLVEIDEDVRTLRLAIEGDDLELTAIEAAIEDLGGSVHSIDEVSVGKRIVEHGDIVDR